MHLTDHDLRQLDKDALLRLKEAAVRRLAERLLADLKEARDRLHQDSRNSSRPPSSDSVYRSQSDTEAKTEPLATEEAQAPSGDAAAPAPASDPDPDPESQPETDRAAPPPTDTQAVAVMPPARRRGHQPGAPGVGRTQQLALNASVDHRCAACAACSEAIPDEAVNQAYGGYDEIEVLPADAAVPGLRLWVTRHLLYECVCPCGHHTRYQAPQAVVRPEWQGAGVERQQMLGPRLAGLVVMLCLRYRLSRGKVQELLLELLGLHLSTGLIDQTLRQSAGQVAAVEELLMAEIERAGLLHVDETPWREHGQLLFLWVFCALTTIVYWIGSRAGEMFVNALPDGFAGVLMSDGYAVYRPYGNRIRCLAHLLRKARGLAEATCRHTAEVGQRLLDLINGLIKTAQAAHDEATLDLAVRQAPLLADLKTVCQCHQNDVGKLGAFCREWLNDWAAIVRPLLDADLPLTNNAAERQLRHWVITRRISFGTRSEQGTRALALLASIIDTCRARRASAWDYLAAAIAAGRHALPMPPLPLVPLATA